MKFKLLGKTSALMILPIGTVLFFLNSCKNDGIPADQMQPIYSADVVPIFSNNCASCHNGKGDNGNYSFDTYENIISSGAIVPGNSAKSKAYKAITSTFQIMPPNNALTTNERTMIRLWIDQGAKK